MQTTKRLFSSLLALCLMALLCVPALGAGLPFDKMEAPDGLAFRFSYPNDGNECIEAVYNVPDDLAAIATLSTDDQQKYYGAAFETCVQFDWAVDNKDGFHYNESWDTITADCPIQKIHGNFVEQSEVLWFEYDAAVNRCQGALTSKEVTIPAEVDEDGEEITEETTTTVRTFDFANHKLYVRARFFVYDYSTETVYTSDWSKTACVNDFFGKDAKLPKVKATDDRPVISKGRVNEDRNGYFCFDITFPEAIQKTAYALKCAGVELNLEAQVRTTESGEWQYWMMDNGLYPYLVGTRQFGVLLTDLEGKIEFRCRLTGGNPDEGTALTTGWSDIFTYEDGEVEILKNLDPFDKEAEAEAARLAAKEAAKCPICHICPFHPFGICMFIWIGIVLVIALIVLYNIRASKKKKAREAEILARQEASRNSNTDKTASIFNTDRIQPIPEKKEEDQ